MTFSLKLITKKKSYLNLFYINIIIVVGIYFKKNKYLNSVTTIHFFFGEGRGAREGGSLKNIKKRSTIVLFFWEIIIIIIAF